MDYFSDGDPVLKMKSITKKMILKSVFSESSTFSKTIFDFLVRFPVILFSDQGAHIKLREI